MIFEDYAAFWNISCTRIMYSYTYESIQDFCLTFKLILEWNEHPFLEDLKKREA